MSTLKSYRAVALSGIKEIVVKKGKETIVLDSMTEEQAEYLYKKGSPYVEKIEGAAPNSTGKPKDSTVS